MVDENLLKIGQKLTILPVSGVLHRVTAGESVLGIAAAYGVEGGRIVEVNRISDPSLVREGDLLIVPDGVLGVDQQPVAAEAQGGQEVAGDREASDRGNQKNGKSFIANVTAYTIQGGTATGTQTHWGTVAVDPRVIPLGSKIRIDGFEETFVAEDTGGGVRGNWVDIWFPDHNDALRFGIQSRRVTIVEP